jgi:hypothetical protein
MKMDVNGLSYDEIEGIMERMEVLRMAFVLCVEQDRLFLQSAIGPRKKQPEPQPPMQQMTLESMNWS